MLRSCILILAAWLPLAAAEPRVLTDVVYGTAGGVELKLDAYLVGGVSPSPVLVFIHGGGWRGGDKKQAPAYVKEPLLEAGVSLISINYRLSDVAVYPAQVDDSTRAVQFVRSKAKEWQLNPRRIAVMGGSAGAHLSLWVGLHDDRAKPKSADPVERTSSRVCAIVNYYGPADFHLAQKFPEKHKHPAYRTLFGYQPAEPLTVLTAAQMEAASPVTYVSADDPPVFTAHGTGDVTVPVEHAEVLIAKLKAAGVKMENYILPGGNHGLSNPQPDWPDFRKATVEFLKKYLLQ